ncbi:aldehyde dehydrogenase (NADP(+)) [Mucilaginibacter sp. Bleaf8]|uniref:aldehyde dehydrogenase (NADP(+)) n=1 Tax=Mucilaginibacter sp. Bleaf8 TaxID=2834430 RepID=UPI001BD0DEF4|nr:aldehyde dehydrogenase (NADP(+)) [Mucilaginibacter sp. Bleaf8]MBS7566775.1 aldehyde dehydrogenase (NADP(+)) [Mucilaginibacter sp. Bleaf8]
MNGNNIVACEYVASSGQSFSAINPATGKNLDGDFYPATDADVNNALQQATEAFEAYRSLDKDKKAAFLRQIAEEITSLGSALVDRASAESGLPAARLLGEMGRTTGQLRMFADLVQEGSWVNAIIDTALLERTPLPRPDIRRMLVALGPVVVFGASNFPLAFSVAGGDTAAALAAGCPVVVKAHPAHPGTSAMVGDAICRAAKHCGLPQGVFSLLYDSGYEVGAALVKHSQTKAVTFTGSFKGGSALIKMAQERPVPIPVFAEMGSINPVVLLPQALNKRADELAAKYAASITLGAGQFCTNPGLLLAIRSDGLNQFKTSLATAIKNIQPATMLTPGIFNNYQTLSSAVAAEKGVSVLAQAEAGESGAVNQAPALVAEVAAQEFLSNPKLMEEVFGPFSLLVVADDEAQLNAVADALQGQLTTTIMAEDDELPEYTGLLNKLANITGRLILNGVPTGVEVCAAMQHGGPYPATNDSRYTSVGSTAIYRFVRPLAWQDWHPSLLPDELKDSNPLRIWRQVNNHITKD